MKRKIRYVSLESSAFLNDVDFCLMNAEERGVYFKIILHLNESDGYLPMNKTLLKGWCNCKNFEKVFEKIKHKFLIKNGKISHKRVLRELKRARQISQLQRQNGVKGNEIRWENHRLAIAKGLQSDSKGIPKRSEGEAKGSEGEAKGSEGEDKRREEKKSEETIALNADGTKKVRLSVSQLAAKLASQSVSSNSFSPRLAPASASPPQLVAQATAGGSRSRPPAPIPKDLTLKITNLYDELCFIFPKRTPADTSSIRNLTDWVADCIRLGKFQDKIIGDVLMIARDSKKGKSRKPIAVFYSQLKTDLGYKQDG